MGENNNKGNDAIIIFSIGIVWVVCTIGLGFTSMVMYGVATAWKVGFSVFFLMGGAIWWAESQGKKANAAESGEQADSPPEEVSSDDSEE
jgi:hypothetical protein